MLGVVASEADLILDLQLVDGVIPSYESLIRRLPDVETWRTLTVLAGSFPVDLSHLRANNTYVLNRNEWGAWQKELQRVSRSMIRIPSFGDYTIQHAIYMEPVAFPHVSASIRYATPDSWVVLRGEWIGKKNGAGSAQYPAEAQLLIGRKDYCGENYSFGDGFIAEKARNGSNPGNAAQWLTSGINHHVTLTSKMVQTVLSPATKVGTVVSIQSRRV
jgi:hypothetical protein